MKENFKYENRLKEPIIDVPAGDPPMAPPDVKTERKDTPSRKKTSFTRRVRRGFQDFLGGDYLSKQTVAGNIGFILYLGLLAMVYISNTYYTEKIHKSIDRTNRELKELRFQYITTKSMLMFQGRQSEISQRALGMGLKESKTPPYKIQYAGESLQPTGKP